MTVPAVVAVVALAATLAVALGLPRARWQLLGGTLAAAAVLLTGAVGPAEAGRRVEDLAPVVGFLVAVLLLGRLAADAGLFAALGDRMARGRSGGAPTGLLLRTVVVAALVTATLSLDATVVLLTPVVVVAARAARTGARAPSLATVRLANSASLLLPVSNLTNLLALGATGLTFLGFARLMAPVWLVAVGCEYAVLRWWAARAGRRTAPVTDRPLPPATTAPAPLPRLATAVVVAVLVAFAAGSPFDLEPVWPTLVGAVVLGVAQLRTGRSRPRALLGAAGLPFAWFVLCWSVVVAAVADTAIGDLVDDLVPTSTGLGAVVGLALLAMVVANVVNNLPATLLLVPVAAAVGPVAVLAVLVGVNVGANLTYAGSLANLLWSRGLAGRPEGVGAGRDFHLLGVLTTPATVVVCASVLWAWSALLL